MSGYPDWQTPAQIATEIAAKTLTMQVPGTVDIATPSPVDVSAATVTITPAAGYIAPGLTANLITETAKTVAAGSTYSPSKVDVSAYTSVDISLTAYCASQGTASAPLTVALRLDWYDDSGLTYLVGQEKWWAWLSSSSATAQALTGPVPCRGRYLNVVLENNAYGSYAPSEAVTVDSLVVYGSNRTVAAAGLVQRVPSSITTGVTRMTTDYQASGSEIHAGIWAGLAKLSLTAGTTYWQPLPVMAGPAQALWQSSKGLTNVLNLLDGRFMVNGTIGQGGRLWNPASVDGTDYAAALAMPRGPCYAWLATGTVAPEVSLSLISAR